MFRHIIFWLFSKSYRRHRRAIELLPRARLRCMGYIELKCQKVTHIKD